jgi:hypothetical protein
MALVGSISGSFGLVGVSGSMEPAVDNAYSLGNAGKKWSSVVATALSGSLTNLADGSSFLVAGSNVTITSASNGQVTIASTGGGGSNPVYIDSTTQHATFITGTLAVVGAEGIDAASDKGADVYFYVSGSTAGGIDARIALFSGNVVTSGSFFAKNSQGVEQISIQGGNGVISGSGNLQAGGTLTVAGDAQLNGGTIATTASTFNIVNSATTVNLGTSSTTVNIGQASNAINVAGNLDVNGTTDLAGTVTLSGTGQAVTHSGGGNLTISSTTGNVIVESTIFSGNDVTIPGNLTVNGSVVSVASDNLKVKDSVILLGSGSTTANAKSAIVLVSGSSATDRSLIVGSIGVASPNTVGFARMDVQDGGIAGSALDYSDLVDVRAAEYQVGGAGAYLSSSNGTTFILSGTTGLQKIGGAAGFGIEFSTNNTAIATIKNQGTDTLFGGDGPSAARGLILTGNFVAVDYSTGIDGIRFDKAGSTFLKTTLTTGSPNVARIESAVANNNVVIGTSGATGQMIVSGSTVSSIVGSGGFLVSRDSNANPILNIRGQLTTPLIRAEQTNATLTVGTNGGTTDKLILSGTSVDIKLANLQALGIYKDNTQFLNITSNLSRTVVQGAVTNLPTIFGGQDGYNAVLSGSIAVLSGSTSIDFITGSVPGRAAFFGLSAGLPGLHPATDSAFNLGSPSLRWANIYTGDLHLRNDRGNWTIIEEADFLTITNNLNGKRYKFVMEEL